MKLYGRRSRVIVGVGLGAIRAGLDVGEHRVAGKITKTEKPEPNDASVTIWNLSRSQRDSISELQPTPSSTRGVPVLVELGYEEGIHQVFLGDLRTVTHQKDGADWLTTIESGDGEVAKRIARVKVSTGPGTPIDVALRAVVKALGVDAGNVTKIVGQLKAAGVAKLFTSRMIASGSAAEHMTNFCNSAGLQWSIQDGAIQITGRGRALSPVAVRLTPNTGLVGSPSVDPKGLLSATALIQPKLTINGLVSVESRSVTGTYRITKVTWDFDTHGDAWYAQIEGARY